MNQNRLASFAKKYNILEQPEIQNLVSAAAMSGSENVQKVAAQALIRKAIQHHQYPFDSVSFNGEIKLGETFQNRMLAVPTESLTKHFLAVGQSGSGKTTLFYSLMNEVERPFWAFDLKQDYRYVDDVLVLPWTELRFNPLKPPEGVSPRRWAQVFSEIFGHATSLLSGSKNYLMKKIFELYQLYNLFDRVSEPYPSLHELELLIERDGINFARKQSDYRDTLLNRLESMNLVSGTVFDCSQGYSISELLRQDVVFEFDGLSRDVQNFLMEILFAFVYEYRMAQNHRGQGLNHVFFLDEGKRVFSVYKERQDASGIPEIDELTAKMREFGEGLVVADQEASKLTDSIKANTYTKALLPTAGRKQFEAMTEAMNLSERQAEFAQSLGIGEAVIQVGNSGPVPVKLDNYQVDKSMSDRELEKSQRKRWANLQYEARKTTPKFKDKLSGRTEDLEEPDIPEDPKEIELSDGGEQMLKNVIEHPFKSLTERYSSFSSSYKGNKAKNELVDQGVVVERSIRVGDQKKLLQLTEKGRDHASKHLDIDTKQKGRGGIIHRYWQHQIKDAFEEAGWHSFLEKFDADVYVNMGNTELAVEVAMGDNPREIQHVEDHLDRGFMVWVVCRNRKVLEKLKQRIEENSFNADSVAFRLFREISDAKFNLE